MWPRTSQRETLSPSLALLQLLFLPESMPRDGEAGVRANSAQESYSQLKAELQIPRFARNDSGGLQTVRCKNLGDALRVPSFASCSCFSVSFSSWLSSWLP